MKKVMRRIVGTTGIALAVWVGMGQALAQTVQVSGMVIHGQTQQELPFVTVQVLSLADSSLLAGGITDERGIFVLSAPLTVTPVSVVLTYLGMEEWRSQHLEGMLLDLDVGRVVLSPQAYALDGVEVRALRPLLSVGTQGLTMNVAQTILAKGSNVRDILKLAPGMAENAVGELSFRGQTGLVILVDGKLVQLSGAQLEGYLLNLASEGIDAIEIMSNPPARFDAAGSAGVINIKTLKNKLLGLGGSARLGVRAPQRYRVNGGVDLNYRPSQTLNFYTQQSLSTGESISERSSVRRLTLPTNQTETVDQNGQQSYGWWGYYQKTGMDWLLAKRHEFTVEWETTLDDDREQLHSTSLLSRGSIIDSSVLFRNRTQSQTQRQAGGITYRWNLDTLGTLLEARADYTRQGIRSAGRLSSAYTLPMLSPEIIGEVDRRADMPFEIDLFATRLDFSKRIQEVAFEAGWKSSLVEIDNRFSLFEADENELWQLDRNRSDAFSFQEWVHAGYASAAFGWAGLAVTAGLRLENSITEGVSEFTGQRFTRQLLNLFPNLQVQKSGDNYSGYLSYSRRINRPNYNQLNPFTRFLDNYAFERGNPALRPQFSHQVEVSLSYRHQHTVSVYANHTTPLIMPVPVENVGTKEITTTYQNFGRSTNAGLYASTSIQPKAWWSIYMSAGIYYTELTDTRAEAADAATVAGIQGYYLNAYQGFSFPGNNRVEVTLSYQGANRSFWVSREVFTANVAWQHEFKDQTQLAIRLDDVFGSTTYLNSFRYQEVNLVSFYNPNATRVTVSLSRPFGNQQSQRLLRESSSTLEEELNRMQ